MSPDIFKYKRSIFSIWIIKITGWFSIKNISVQFKEPEIITCKGSNVTLKLKFKMQFIRNVILCFLFNLHFLWFVFICVLYLVLERENVIYIS